MPPEGAPHGPAGGENLPSRQSDHSSTDAVSLRPSFWAKVDAAAGITAAGKLIKKERQMAIPDNPKIWRELNRRASALEAKVWKLKEQADKKKQKEEERKYALADMKEIFLSDELIQELKELLADYRIFKKASAESDNFYDGNKLVGIFIENLAHQKQLDLALEVYRLAPDGNLETAKTLMSAVYNGFGKKWDAYKKEKEEAGVSPEKKIEEMWYRDWREYLARKLEGQPDLEAVDVLHLASQSSERKPAERQLAVINKLLARPDRYSFLPKFSPFPDDLKKIIDPESRQRLFRIFLKDSFKTIVANFDFFKADFENISKEERAAVINMLAQKIAGLYSGGDNQYARNLDERRSYYNSDNNYATNSFVFKFIKLVRITPGEKDKIWAALEPRGARYERSARKDIHWVKQKHWQRGHSNFLGDLAADYPEALLLNGPALLGYESVPDGDEKAAEEKLFAHIFRTRNSPVIYALLARWGIGDIKQWPTFGRVVELVKYTLAENERSGLKVLAKAVHKLYNYELGDEIERKILVQLLQAADNYDSLNYFLASKGKYNFNSFTPAQKEFYLEKLFALDNADLFKSFIPFFPQLTPNRKYVFTEYAIAKQDDNLTKAFLQQFDNLTLLGENAVLKFILASGKAGLLESLFVVLEKSESAARSAVPDTRAIRAYIAESGIADATVLKTYIGHYVGRGSEQATAYLEALKQKAKGLIGREVNHELRQDPDYQYLVRYVFPAGNYSTHEKNLACGDRPKHVSKYKFNKDGYPAELTGLLGYRLRSTGAEEGGVAPMQDNLALYGQYEGRLKSIRDFVASRGPDNKALQQSFDSQVDHLFNQYATAEFKKIKALKSKEKMLVLFIVEALRKNQVAEFTPNTDILDLVVKYKYAYHENLEAYIQRSAHDVEQHRDAASQRFLLWQELSNIYGENVKHVLRHNIFEELAGKSENYDKIVEVFGSAVSLSAENFELSAREFQSVDNICKKKISAEEKRALVADKLADLFGPQLKLKGDDEKKAEQQRQYDLERGQFVSKMVALLGNSAEELDARQVGVIIANAFKLNPRQLARFENTFDNRQIPAEDVEVGGKPRDGKYKVLLKQAVDIFGSNIKFKDEEEARAFRDNAEFILEPIKANLTKEAFLALIPKFKTLRNQYRFGINEKLGELFALDLNAINRELAKFEEVVETEAKEDRIGGPKDKAVKKSVKKRKIRTYVTKTRETANARMGAYLCIAGDVGMWDNDNYLEAVDQDEETGKCVGLTMYLDIPAEDGKRYLWVGPNPFESFLTQVSAEKALEHQYVVAVDFATQNGFDGIVVPPEDGQILGSCTNRGGNFPDLIKAKRLKDKNGNLWIVDFGKEHKLGGGYGYDKGALIWKRAD